MSSKACSREFNAQIQALNARIKQLEENVAASHVQSMFSFFSLWTGLMANGSTIPAATLALATHPFGQLIIDMATGSLNLGSIKQMYDMAKNLGADQMKEILLKMALENLNIPPYGDQLMDAVEGAINDAIADADAALLAAIAGGIPSEIAAATAALNELNAQAASIVGMVQSSNNASVCKTASSVLGF